jgi:hypothetical protein
VARGAAGLLDQAVTGGMVGAGVKGDKALVKQAGVNAAALATGYIAGKAVQKAAPVIQNKLGNELGVHLSNTDKLKKIKFSDKRAGTGSDYQQVKPNQTYKFAPYHYVGDPEFDPTDIPGKVYGRTSLSQLGKTVAAQNIDMAGMRDASTYKYAYVTKSKPGVSDPDFPAGVPSFTVPKQKVLEKVNLPIMNEIDYYQPGTFFGDQRGSSLGEIEVYEQVENLVTNALLRQEASMKTNTQTAVNAIRGVSAVATQQALNKNKGRKGGAKRR